MCQTHTPPSDRSKVTVCSPNSTTNMTAGSRAERPLHIHGSDRLCSCEGSYCAAVNTHTHRHRVLCLFKGQRRFTVTAVWAPGSAARCDLAPWPLVIFCYYMAEFILSKHLLLKKKNHNLDFAVWVWEEENLKGFTFRKSIFVLQRHLWYEGWI